jgi:hypothetical protein
LIVTGECAQWIVALRHLLHAVQKSIQVMIMHLYQFFTGQKKKNILSIRA